MRIEKEYRQLDNIEEVRIYDIREKELFIQMPKEFDVPEIPYKKTLKNILNNIDLFITYKDDEKFIMHRLDSNDLIS